MDVLFSEILQGIQDLWRQGDEKISGGAGWCRSNNTQTYFVEGESGSMHIYIKSESCSMYVLKVKSENTQNKRRSPVGAKDTTFKKSELNGGL